MMFVTLITALVLTLSVIPCPAMAKSVKIPAAYHGVWCAIGDIPTNKYRRCRELRGEQDLEIRARSIFNGEVDCKPLAVKPKGNSHLVRSHCIFDIGERSSRQDLGPTKWERWRLTDGGRRLEINETSNKAE
jgi:hypothetical protein